MTPNDTLARPTVLELARFFLWLGTAGFGGPIALIGCMDRTLVREHGWVTRQEFNDALAFCQLAPGPLAAQLAIYIGWLRCGVRGATAVGIAFIGPSFVMVIALAVLYQRAGGMAWLQGAFYGVGAAVIAIIARSAVKLARATLGTDALWWATCVISALVTAWTESEIVWVFLLAGIIGVAVRGRPVWNRARLHSLAISAPATIATVLQRGPDVAAASSVFVYFATAGLFVFGSGLAIVPFLHGGVVIERAWLSEREFLDAVAVALITPGPVVITVAFIGFLVAGLTGAIAAAAGVFAPVYIITVLLAPHYQRLKAYQNVGAFVAGVTAAATGAIAGAAIVLGRRAIVDLGTLLIAVAALALITIRKRLPDPIVIVAAGMIGVLIAFSR